ncbi:MotA/TolQ/ExbB proton channel family protein [Magnetovibrio sp.]|uniref:MotA/TolQ/ExbB proton channel family protein n=1 Tax=Magnetovibrio sp. TaxID=2024836 RepID=UPI002F93859B
MESGNLELLSWWGDADWIVRGVFIILIALSVISWTIMVYKSWQLSSVYRRERAYRGQGAPAYGLPSAHVVTGLTDITGDERETMAGALVRESRLDMEAGLTLLATIGNTAPFIGLFGTVWGIMHALQSLGGAEALSMDMVAGPVAEALVATAAGLFTAIPAVVGYNLLLRQLRRLFGVVEANAVRILAGANKNGSA